MTNGIIDSGQEIVTNGLVLHLDAAQRRSYSGTGTTWTDLSGNSNNGTLTNGPTFNPANGGSIQFDGVDDYINCGTLSNFGSTMSSNGVSIDFIFNSTYTSDFKPFGIINDGSNTLLVLNFNRDQNDNYAAKKTSFSIRGDGGVYLLGAIDTDIYTGKNFM